MAYSTILISAILFAALFQSTAGVDLAHRIRGESRAFEKPALGISAKVNEDDVTDWNATIEGPAGSPYEGGTFHLKIKLPKEYPHKPPLVWFTTPIYHPNVTSSPEIPSGLICINILKEDWRPVLLLHGVLLSIQQLLAQPNPDDPLMPTIAEQYQNDHKQFEATAKEWTTKYAMPPV